MTFATDQTALVAPMIAGYSETLFTQAGENFTPPAMTGSGSSPAAWVLWDWELAQSDYLTFKLGSRWKRINIECAIFVEPLGGGKKRALDIADALETAYDGADTATTFFRLPEARLQPFGIDNDTWLRYDWTMRVWLFDTTLGEDLAVGQSANQIQITQAAHGFSVKHWIGYNGSTWVKGKAAIGSTYSQGVVSTVTSSSVFTVTVGDIVALASHGWTKGPIFSDQSTEGDARATAPGSGIIHQMGTAISDDHVLVRIGEIEEI